MMYLRTIYVVFNFANGQHDVAKVGKSGFDGCNGGSAVFTVTTSPTTVTLNETGEQYYICTFGTHCSLGQKLAINVTKATSPSPSPSPASAPRPSTNPSPKTSPIPAPAPAPAPTTTPSPSPTPTAAAPSSAPVTYTVGDRSGWTIPSGGAAAYQTWTSGKTFNVGDILLFNFQSNAHNVEEVTKDKFDSCSSASPLATYNNPPVSVALNKSGPHYFICGIPGHCSAGQKLAIDVSATATPSPSPSSTTNPSSPSPAGVASPPPQNSATPASLGLSATFLSIAAAFFFFC